MKAGRIETQIDRAMRLNPTVLLVLSENSRFYTHPRHGLDSWDLRQLPLIYPRYPFASWYKENAYDHQLCHEAFDEALKDWWHQRFGNNQLEVQPIQTGN